jgi:hypothetical protein
MFCYECDQSGSAVGAIAICQRCGGAMCREHANRLSQPGAPGGMLGLSQPKQEHVCSRCLTGTFLKPAHISARERKGSPHLPDATIAVQIADTLVRHQSRMQVRRQERWRSLTKWLSHLLPWGRNKDTKDSSPGQPTAKTSQEG